MLVLPQEVEVKWERRNKPIYVDKDYIFTKIGDTFMVNINDLAKNSPVKIKVICDYCLEEGLVNIIKKEYRSYLNGRKFIDKDCCDNRQCIEKKKRETSIINYGTLYPSQTKEYRENQVKANLKKYGVENYMQTDECKAKIKQTCLERYGCENPMQNNEVKNKLKQTNLERYGVESYTQTEEYNIKTKETGLNKYGKEYYMQTEEYKEKYKNTCQEKYGCDAVLQNAEVKQKIKETNLKRYGVEYISQVPEVRDKVRQTLFKNGTAQCSQQQEYVYNLIGGELNYSYNNLSLDIAFSDENIYCECDFGGHWLSIKFGDITEEEFIKKEKNRWYFLYRKGWREIRIISRKDKLPSDEVVFLMFEFARDYLNSGHSWIHFDIDNNIIECSQFKNKCDFGKLRKIKKAS